MMVMYCIDIMAATEAQKAASKKYRENNKEKVLERQRVYRSKQNAKMTTKEENTIVNDGKTFKQLIRHGKDWESEYLIEGGTVYHVSSI